MSYEIIQTSKDREGVERKIVAEFRSYLVARLYKFFNHGLADKSWKGTFQWEIKKASRSDDIRVQGD